MNKIQKCCSFLLDSFSLEKVGEGWRNIGETFLGGAGGVRVPGPIFIFLFLGVKKRHEPFFYDGLPSCSPSYARSLFECQRTPGLVSF